MNGISIHEMKKHEILNIEFWVVSTHTVKIFRLFGQGIKLPNYKNSCGTCVEMPQSVSQVSFRAH